MSEEPIYTTDAGMPRPLTYDGRYPVPWNAVATRLGKLISPRRKLTARGAHCQVCGERLDRGRRALMFVRPEDDEGNAIVVAASDRSPTVRMHATDDGLLHPGCAALALKHCPVLRKDRAEGALWVFLVPTFAGVEFRGDECDAVPVAVLDWFVPPEE